MSYMFVTTNFMDLANAPKTQPCAIWIDKKI